jgi:hypothetical protein
MTLVMWEYSTFTAHWISSQHRLSSVLPAFFADRIESINVVCAFYKTGFFEFRLALRTRFHKQNSRSRVTLCNLSIADLDRENVNADLMRVTA